MIVLEICTIAMVQNTKGGKAMKYPSFSRVLSVVLALVMVRSMLPAAAFASDSAIATLVTDVSSCP